MTIAYFNGNNKLQILWCVMGNSCLVDYFLPSSEHISNLSDLHIGCGVS